MKSVTIDELFEALKNEARLLDVRESFEYSAGHVPQAISLPMSELEERLTEVQTGDYIICQSGARSANCVAFLEANGIETINVEGGTSAWKGCLAV